MGYGTSYSLELTLLIGGKPASLTDNAPLRELIRQLRAASEEACYAIAENGGTANSDAKWYEHEGELRTLSSKYPGILFMLCGAGEEAGDVWKKYFLDGRCQVARAQMQIAPFDPKELK